MFEMIKLLIYRRIRRMIEGWKTLCAIVPHFKEDMQAAAAAGHDVRQLEICVAVSTVQSPFLSFTINHNLTEI